MHSAATSSIMSGSMKRTVTKDKNKELPWSESRTLGKVLKAPFTKGLRQVKIEELSADDVIIGVMGPTGSGKSSFIELATGIEGLVGHSLKSCTDEISVIKFSAPEILDSDICLVDTPGFDDTNKSDVDIFRMISDWLNDTYKRDISLAGLLYFHRITDNRMAGTPLKNLRLFEKLCGKEFSTIVLTTTMWDEVERETGTHREQELQDIYWKSMIDRGSTVKRFLYSRASAFDVLQPILSRANENHSLLLQQEMTVLHMKLKETTAGRALALQLEELVPRQQELLKAIREDLLDPKLRPEQLEKLMQDYQEVSAKLLRVMSDIEVLKISVGERFLKFVAIKNWKGFRRIFRIKKGQRRHRVLSSIAIDRPLVHPGRINTDHGAFVLQSNACPSPLTYSEASEYEDAETSHDRESIAETEGDGTLVNQNPHVGNGTLDGRTSDAQAELSPGSPWQMVHRSLTPQAPPPSIAVSRPANRNRSVKGLPGTHPDLMRAATPAIMGHAVEFGRSDSRRSDQPPRRKRDIVDDREPSDAQSDVEQKTDQEKLWNRHFMGAMGALRRMTGSPAPGMNENHRKHHSRQNSDMRSPRMSGIHPEYERGSGGNGYANAKGSELEAKSSSELMNRNYQYPSIDAQWSNNTSTASPRFKSRMENTIVAPQPLIQNYQHPVPYSHDVSTTSQRFNDAAVPPQGDGRIDNNYRPF